MSRAFTKDGDEHARPVVPPRAPLPEGTPNYVTPRGLALLKEEMLELERERRELGGVEDRRDLGGIDGRRDQLADRIASAVVVDPAAQQDAERVRFGASVRVRTTSGELRTYRIVGVDEADAASGLIAFAAPVARALLGREVGEVAVVRTPRGDERLEVEDITYG